MASARAVPLLTTTRAPLVIRAPLSTHDDTDSDISPVYSDASQNSFRSASEEETATVVSGATTLDASSTGVFARIPSMPVAKITGDDETESTDEEEAEKDKFLPLVAKVAELKMADKDEVFDSAGEKGSEKQAFEEGGSSSNNVEIPVTSTEGREKEQIDTENYSVSANEDNSGPVLIANSNQTDLNQEIKASISNDNKEDLNEVREDFNEQINVSESINGDLDSKGLDEESHNFPSSIINELGSLNLGENDEILDQNANDLSNLDHTGLDEESLSLSSRINNESDVLNHGENLDQNANDLSDLRDKNDKEGDNLNDNSNKEIGENNLYHAENADYNKADDNLGFAEPSLNPNENQENSSIESINKSEMEPQISIKTNENKDNDLISDEAMDGESSISSAFSNSNLDFENSNFTEEKEDGGEETVEFNPSALAAYIREKTDVSSNDTITISYKSDGPRLVSVDRAPPVGLPALHPVHSEKNQKTQIQIQQDADVAISSGYDADFLNFLNEKDKKIHEKVQLIRVKFIRLVYKLGLTLDEKIASDVLSRLTLAEGLRFKMPFNEGLILENAKNKALKLNSEGIELNFSFRILVLGKTGVGKSALINSIFKNEKSRTDPFLLGTEQVKEISGQVDGVNLHMIDTPGLQTSLTDQTSNKKLLSSLKKIIKKSPIDSILYVDRADIQTRNFNDSPVLRSITEVLGQSIWSKAVKTLTHASSAPPEGPSGSQLDYQMYVTQRAHGIQQAIRMATRDGGVANPLALVENHFLCRKNHKGEMVLPNGIAWRPNLLLLCYSMKILKEVDSLLNSNSNGSNNSGLNKGFGSVSRPLPLKYLMSSILESKTHLKLVNGVVELESEIDDFVDSDLERENEADEYDNLPPFKPLTKSQIEKLTKEQKRAYFDEYKYRVKLLERKKWMDEMKRLKEAKNNSSGSNGSGFDESALNSEPLQDMVLPLSFDSDCPLYRYRSIRPNGTGQTGYRVQVRPLLDPQGWDHDCGYNGVSLDQSLAILNHFPASTRLQLKKDKEEFNIHLDSSICISHADVASSLTSFEIQPMGRRHLAYILNGETKFKTSKRNLTTGGVSVIFLGDRIAPCLKVEDSVRISKRASLTGSAGAVYAKDGGILGCNLEARVRDSVGGLSLLKLKNEVSLGANLETNFEGLGSNFGVNLGLNSKGNGRIGLKVSSCENVQIRIVGLISIGVAIINHFRNGGEYEEQIG